jgi:hypothetical protein
MLVQQTELTTVFKETNAKDKFVIFDVTLNCPFQSCLAAIEPVEAMSGRGKSCFGIVT